MHVNESTERFAWTTVAKLPMFSVGPDSHSGEITVCSLDLNQPDQQVTRLERLLSVTERARAARYLRRDIAAHFIVCRAGLRQILSSALGMHPTEIQFAYSPNGRPELVLPPGVPPVVFSVSHSGASGIIAVGVGLRLGIDLERRTRQLDALALSRRFFHATESQQLESLSGIQQYHAFFDCWTRKEAYIKAIGLGLACPLDQFVVSVLPQDPPRIVSIAGDEVSAAVWTLPPLTFAPDFSVALAVEGVPGAIHGFNWDFSQD